MRHSNASSRSGPSQASAKAGQQKRSINGGLFLFGAIFFFVGLSVAGMMAGPALLTGVAAKHWVSTNAELLEARLYCTGGKNPGCEALARYRYEVDGLDYENDRVALFGGNDNIGDFQKRLGRELETAFANKEQVQVWYDPANPVNAVLNREIRWGLIAFMGIFVLLFSGVGLGIMLASLRGAGRSNLFALAPGIIAAMRQKAQGVSNTSAVAGQAASRPQSAQKPSGVSQRQRAGSLQAGPWLRNKAWQQPRIESTARTKVRQAWVLVLFALISGVFFFLFNQDLWQGLWRAQSPGAVFVALLFLLLSLMALGVAIGKTLAFRRTGSTPLLLDPFPGAIGGDLGGSLELVGLRYHPSMRVELTLSCLQLTQRGRTRNETLIWQSKGCAKVLPGAKGVSLGFRFQIPEGLPQSSLKETEGAHVWRLLFKLTSPVTSLAWDYALPVFATGASAKLRQPLARELCPGDSTQGERL